MKKFSRCILFTLHSTKQLFEDFGKSTGKRSVWSLLQQSQTLYEKYPYPEFFWSVFCRNTRKYGTEKLRIRTLFTQLKS